MWFLNKMPLGDIVFLGDAIGSKEALANVAFFFKSTPNTFTSSFENYFRSFDNPLAQFQALLTAWPFARDLPFNQKEESSFRILIRDNLTRLAGFRWEQRSFEEWVGIVSGRQLNPKQYLFTEDMVSFLSGQASLAELKEKLYCSLCTRWPLLHFLNWDFENKYPVGALPKSTTETVDFYCPLEKAGSGDPKRAFSKEQLALAPSLLLPPLELFNLVLKHIPNIMPTFVWDYQFHDQDGITYRPAYSDLNKGDNFENYIKMQICGLRSAFDTGKYLEMMRENFYRADADNLQTLVRRSNEIKGLLDKCELSIKNNLYLK